MARAWAKTAGDGQSGSGRPRGDEWPNGDFVGHFLMVHQVFSRYPDDRNGAEWGSFIVRDENGDMAGARCVRMMGVVWRLTDDGGEGGGAGMLCRGMKKRPDRVGSGRGRVRRLDTVAVSTTVERRFPARRRNGRFPVETARYRRYTIAVCSAAVGLVSMVMAAVSRALFPSRLAHLMAVMWCACPVGRKVLCWANTSMASRQPIERVIINIRSIMSVSFAVGCIVGHYLFTSGTTIPHFVKNVHF